MAPILQLLPLMLQASARWGMVRYFLQCNVQNYFTMFGKEAVFEPNVIKIKYWFRHFQTCTLTAANNFKKGPANPSFIIQCLSMSATPTHHVLLWIRNKQKTKAGCDMTQESTHHNLLGLPFIRHSCLVSHHVLSLWWCLKPWIFPPLEVFST